MNIVSAAPPAAAFSPMANYDPIQDAIKQLERLINFADRSRLPDSTTLSMAKFALSKAQEASPEKGGKNGLTPVSKGKSGRPSEGIKQPTA
jgi:hypothetical protein